MTAIPISVLVINKAKSTDCQCLIWVKSCVSLYARGMTVREIQIHLEEMYGTEVSPTLISSVTDAVIDEVKAWQARPLDALYPMVYLDCIHVKVRDGSIVGEISNAHVFEHPLA